MADRQVTGIARRRLPGLLALGAGTLALPACESFTRLDAVPRDATQRAMVLGVPNERFYFLHDAEAINAEALAATRREREAMGLGPAAPMPALNLLAVSGGGEDGAFGAGLLCGWTASGTRPVFDLVTGVSTGALTAPFAFLGPQYDGALRDVYTNVTLRDIAASRFYATAIFADALSDTTPLYQTISRHLTEAMLTDLAAAYRSGRLLVIGTTNLDAQIPVMWNIGAIADSGHPRALDLIRRILLASAAVPGAFPPVMIDVTADGKPYQEMHVDGGAFAQAFLYPRSVSADRADRRRRGIALRGGTVWVIRNGRLDPGWASVRRRVFGIVGRAISTMIATSGFNDVLRMYNAAREDGFAYRLAYIGSDFTPELPAPFDQAYMRALFDYGVQRERAGRAWVGEPPGSALPDPGTAAP